MDQFKRPSRVGTGAFMCLIYGGDARNWTPQDALECHLNRSPNGSQNRVELYGLAPLEVTRTQTLAPWVRESISYPSQCRANVFAQTTTESVLDGPPYGRDAGIHEWQRIAKLFSIRYTDLGEGCPVKPVPNFLALDKFGTVVGLFRFSLLPCHLSNYSAPSSLIAEGI